METFIQIAEGDGDIFVQYDKDYAGGEFADLRVDVDLGPNPTWPSPSETIEYTVNAVRDLMRLAWERSTGDKLEPEPEKSVDLLDDPWQQKPDKPVIYARRAPEANVQVFELGTYEQMQIDKVLQAALYDGFQDKDVDLACLAGLVHIFGSHGSVAVTRTNQEG